IISGNTGVAGVVVRGTASGTRLQGNLIGSTSARGPTNKLFGVNVTDTAAATTIGGTGVGEGNIIAGNDSAGISVTGTPTGTLIQGNNIGIMADDTRNGNVGAGIFLFGGSKTTIGGTNGLGLNVISNNATGIEVSGAATGTVIRGNLIGTNLAGTQ